MAGRGCRAPSCLPASSCDSRPFPLPGLAKGTDTHGHSSLPVAPCLHPRGGCTWLLRRYLGPQMHPKYIPANVSQIHPCKGIPNKTLSLTLGHWWPPGRNGLEPFWAQGPPSPALLPYLPPLSNRACRPKEKLCVIPVCHQALPSARVGMAGPAPSQGFPAQPEPCGCSPPALQLWARVSLVIQGGLKGLLSPRQPGPLVCRHHGSVFSASSRLSWLLAGGTAPLVHVLRCWGGLKGSFLLEQMQIVQVGGGDGAAQVSTEGKCPCPQAEGHPAFCRHGSLAGVPAGMPQEG